MRNFLVMVRATSRHHKGSGELDVCQTLRYICECFCELLGSIILSACLVWGGCSFFGHYPAGASVW